MNVFDLQRCSDGDRIQGELAILQLSRHDLNSPLFEDSDVRLVAPREFTIARPPGPALQIVVEVVACRRAFFDGACGLVVDLLSKQSQLRLVDTLERFETHVNGCEIVL